MYVLVISPIEREGRQWFCTVMFFIKMIPAQYTNIKMISTEIIMTHILYVSMSFRSRSCRDKITKKLLSYITINVK